MTWAPDYTDAATVQTYIRAGLDNDQTSFIAQWITATSRNVDDYCGRQFGNTGTAEARTYEGQWDNSLYQWIYEIDDVQNTAGMTVLNGATPLALTTDYTLLPRNAPQKGWPITQLRTSVTGVAAGFLPAGTLRPTLTISAIWGWTAVPKAASVGVLLQAARLAKRRDSPFGVAGSPANGSEIRLLAQLDPDFRTTLQPYRRNWWAF